MSVVISVPDLDVLLEAHVRLGANAVRPRCEQLETALRMVLLFLSAGPWNSEKDRQWRAFAGDAEASTKAMCDQIRAVLLEPGRAKAKT